MILTTICLLAVASISPAKAAEASFPPHYFDRSTPPLTVRHVQSTEGDLHPPPPPLGRHARLHHPIFPPLRRRPSQGGDTAPPYAVQMEPLVKYSPRDPLYEGNSEETKEDAKGTEPPQSLDADLEGGAATLSVAEEKAGHHYPVEEPRRGLYSFPTFPQGPRYVILREPEPIIEIIVKESNHTLPAPTVPTVIHPKRREPVQVFYVKYERKKNKSGDEKVVFEPPVAAKEPTSPEPLPPVHIPEETETVHPLPTISVPVVTETTTLRAVIHPESERVHHPHSRAPTLRVTFGEHHKDGEEVEEEQSAPQPSFAAPSWGGHSQIPPFRQLPEQHLRGHQGSSRYFGPNPQRPEFPPQQQQSQQFSQHQQQSPDSRAFPHNRLPSYPQGVRQPYPPYRPELHRQQQQALFRQQQLQQFHQQQNKHPLQFQEQYKQQNQPFLRIPNQQPPIVPTYHPQHSVPTQSPQYPSSSSSIPPFVRVPNSDRFPEPSGTHSPGGDIVKSITQSEQHQFQSPPSQGQFLNVGHQIPKLQPTNTPLVRNNQPNGPANFQQQQHQLQQHQQQQHQLQQQQHQLQQQQQQQHQLQQQQQHQQQQHHQQQQLKQQQSFHHPAQGVQPTTNPLHNQGYSTPISTSQNPNYFTQQSNNNGAQINFQQSTVLPTPIPRLNHTVAPHSKDPPSTIKQINSLSHPSRQQETHSTTTQSPTTSETTTRKLPDLPDEIPDDLRQQLLSSGILDNADIQILDYDKVGDIPIESLPPEALAGLQGAGSENKPVSVKAPKDPVEMKVVRYTPDKEEATVDGLIRDDVEETRVLAPVTTSIENEGFRRYLPLRIAGERFPVPDVPELRGRNVTSVVVLAPVGFPDSTRGSRAEERSDEMKSVTLDRLNLLVKEPTAENFKEWLEMEKKASAEEQAVVLLVSPKDGQPEEKGEIFMYDVGNSQVSQLRGELSAAFVRVAKENASEQ